MAISRVAISDMIPNRKGVWAEKVAARFLLSRGYIIRAMRAATRAGEIDIVAQKDTTLIFVEVKMRMNNSMAQAEAAVDYHKQQRIARAIQMYVYRHGLSGAALRFDVVTLFRKTPFTFGIRHYNNVQFLPSI